MLKVRLIYLKLIFLNWKVLLILKVNWSKIVLEMDKITISFLIKTQEKANLIL